MLDIYDPAGTWLGVKTRAAVHQDGDWHRVFHCWIIGRDANGRDSIALQKRGPDKQTYPNLFDVTAAGHYSAGEAIADGVREIEEELGIAVAFEDLIPVGRRRDAVHFAHCIDNEMADVFFLIGNWPLNRYHLAVDEVAGLAVVAIADALALVAGECESVEAAAVGLGAVRVALTRADLVPPRPDAYFYRILLLARRCLDGERDLAI